MTLRALFVALESGATAVPRADLVKEMTAAEVEALRAARVVKQGPAFQGWPCDQPGTRCGREVLGAARGAAKPFVAVCEGSCEHEDRCADVALDADDLARAKIDLWELGRELRAVYRVDGPAATFAKGAAPPSEPVRLGEERTEARTREVFVALVAARDALARFLEARERATRPTLVLVPTGRALAPAMTTRHAPGAHVEIEVLEDAIVCRDGKLVRATKLRLVSSLAEAVAPLDGYGVDGAEAADADVGAARAGGIAAQLGAKSFAELAFRVIDGHTVRITHKRRRVHATYIDLGLGTKKRAPMREWEVLLDVCAGHGKFRWKKYKTFANAKVLVSRLQTALRASFGLEDNAFNRFRVVDGWKARFFASSDIAEEES